MNYADITLSGTSVSVTVHVADTTVTHHCAHGDDRSTYRVTGAAPRAWTTPDLFLVGTVEEMLAFARAVEAAALARSEVVA